MAKKKRIKYLNTLKNLPTPKRKRHKAGAPPGSLVFTGEQKMTDSIVTFLQYDKTEIDQQAVPDDKLPDVELEKVNWLDMRGLHNVELVERIGRKYKVHPLALEDILDINQRPKADEYETGVFFIFRALQFDKETLELQTEQVGVFFSKHILLSFQENISDLFLPVRERLLASSGRIRERGTDYLAYALIDTVVDYYFSVLDQMDQVVEELEAGILRNPGKETKANIHKLRLSSISLRKSVAPLREAVGRFSRSDNEFVQESSLVYIRDLFDHTVQVQEMTDNYREVINGLHDLYLSEISMKMNNVMQLLTVISTIFIPLTFLTGLYGMNFAHIPELEWRYSYFVLWGVMIVIATGLIIYFKRQDWL